MSHLQPIFDLNSTELKALIQLIKGPLSESWSDTYIQQLLGHEKGQAVLQALIFAEGIGMSRVHITAIMDTLSIQKLKEVDWFTWVITGLASPSLPRRDTAVIYRSLIQQARAEVIISTYAIYNGKELFAGLQKKLKEIPGFRVLLFCDVRRQYPDTSMDSEIIAKFKREFIKKQWPGEPFPVVYYYPPALSMDKKNRAVLHAKCVVVDGQVAFIGSANLTEAAQEKNIEVGVQVEHQKHVQTLRRYFLDLVESEFVEKIDIESNS